MTRYVIDAYAWVEYLDGSRSGEKVKAILQGENEIYTCAVTVAEVASKVCRREMDVNTALEAISTLSKIIEVDFNLAKASGISHAKMREKIMDFGLADSFVLESAKRIEGKIVTGDEHFRDTEGVVFVE
ncbi:MAG: PIN domain-containing protein [Methanocellales archaeon]|nr:PIN domain-containing protein [Methanocellales archaeon]MDI6859905.1 PIN domain-containing protein [Methanocellales archaeon]MDI6903074.1 PIN domain-containing protein [Methanocellales archaeon]